MRATKALIAGVFGRAAPAYQRTGPPFFGVVAARLVALCDLPAGARVLDVATGTGAALLAVAPRAVPGGLLVGSTWPSRWSPRPGGGCARRG
jgi:ubiquinone/menaquinone biosynthesis C-methylase UbiE